MTSLNHHQRTTIAIAAMVCATVLGISAMILTSSLQNKTCPQSAACPKPTKCQAAISKLEQKRQSLPSEREPMSVGEGIATGAGAAAAGYAIGKFMEGL